MVLDDGSYVLFHLAHHEACLSSPPALSLFVPFARAPASRISLCKRKLCCCLYSPDLSFSLIEKANLLVSIGALCDAANEVVDTKEIATIAIAADLNIENLVMLFLPKV